MKNELEYAELNDLGKDSIYGDLQNRVFQVVKKGKLKTVISLFGFKVSIPSKFIKKYTQTSI